MIASSSLRYALCAGEAHHHHFDHSVHSGRDWTAHGGPEEEATAINDRARGLISEEIVRHEEAIRGWPGFRT
jgi:hypothetical protein